MSFIARYPKREYTLCPAGQHQTVLVDIIDLGLQQTAFGAQYRVRFVWQLGFNDPLTGRPQEVIKSFNNSMHSASNLRKFLTGWRGTALGERDAQAFDLETLIGKNAILTIQHVVSETTGKTYADVVEARAVSTEPRLTPNGYTRRNGVSAPPPPPPPPTPQTADPDDDIPF